MLKISEESKEKFVQDKEYVLSYLKSKGVTDKYYLKLIQENDFGCLLENRVFLNSHDMNSGEYKIEAFLSCSPNLYDIIESNKKP